MLYTGTIKNSGTDVYPLPQSGDDEEMFASHARLEAGERVGVLAQTPGGAALFVCPLDDSGAVGWVRGGVRRDAILLADLYWKDVGGKEDWGKVAATLESGPPVFGAMLKATQNTSYPKDAISWFKKQWKALRAAGGSRYGTSWFRAQYHYLIFGKDGAAQAEYNMRVVDSAGGLDDGDIMPVVDLEPSGQPEPPTADQVRRCTEAYVERMNKITGGRGVILYGGNLMRSLKIKDHMGCSWLWTASYGAELTNTFVKAAGWSLAETAWWQYCGDGKAEAIKTKGGAPLPHSVPGLGKVDINVFLQGDLTDLRKKLITARYA